MLEQLLLINETTKREKGVREEFVKKMKLKMKLKSKNSRFDVEGRG